MAYLAKMGTFAAVAIVSAVIGAALHVTLRENPAFVAMLRELTARDFRRAWHGAFGVVLLIGVILAIFPH